MFINEIFILLKCGEFGKRLKGDLVKLNLG